MGVNVISQANGKCLSCGQEGKQHFKSTKGKRKGEILVDSSAYYKVFDEVSCFRGEDVFIGKFCKKCFKDKKYLIKK